MDVPLRTPLPVGQGRHEVSFVQVKHKGRRVEKYLAIITKLRGPEEYVVHGLIGLAAQTTVTPFAMVLHLQIHVVGLEPGQFAF
jgi:hypothetical protein